MASQKAPSNLTSLTCFALCHANEDSPWAHCVCIKILQLALDELGLPLTSIQISTSYNIYMSTVDCLILYAAILNIQVHLWRNELYRNKNSRLPLLAILLDTRVRHCGILWNHVPDTVATYFGFSPCDQLNLVSGCNCFWLL